jgi:hypothetical protein
VSENNLKDSLAESWAETLKGLMSGDGRVYHGRCDEGVRPPFTVVVVKHLERTVRVHGRYVAELRVVHVSEVADSKSAAHGARVKLIEDALDAFPLRGGDVSRGVEIDGWELEDIEDAVNGEDDVFGDVFMIKVGVGKPSV